MPDIEFFSKPVRTHESESELMCRFAVDLTLPIRPSILGIPGGKDAQKLLFQGHLRILKHTHGLHELAK